MTGTLPRLRPRLGALLHRVVGVGMLYLMFSVIEGTLRVNTVSLQVCGRMCVYFMTGLVSCVYFVFISSRIEETTPTPECCVTSCWPSPTPVLSGGYPLMWTHTHSHNDAYLGWLQTILKDTGTSTWTDRRYSYLNLKELQMLIAVQYWPT